MVEAGIAGERTGMWLAFTVAVIMILCGTFLIHEDKDPQGLALIGGTVVTLCGVFVYSRRRERKGIGKAHPPPTR
jgi:hypothetical protein